MAIASASAASGDFGSAFGSRIFSIVRIWFLSAWPAPTTVFLTWFGAYSATAMPNIAGASMATPRACPSFSVATPSLLTKVCSTAASAGRKSPSTAARPSWIASKRLASGRPSGGSTEPQPTNVSRLPSISITPQPVRRRPGSMPRMRTGWRIGAGVMGHFILHARVSSLARAISCQRHTRHRRAEHETDLPSHLGDQRVGDLEIGVDVLDVVVLVQQVDQLQQLLAGLVVHRHGILRFPGQRRLAGLAEFGLQRLGDLAEGLLRGVDLVAVLAGRHVVGAGLDRRIQHRIVGGDLGVIFDDAGTIEHEADRAGLAEIAAGLGEVGADIGRRAVAVVGQGLDDHGDAARTIALVANLVVVLALAADRLLYRALDRVLRHVLLAGGNDRGAQPRVHRRVGLAQFGGDGNFPRQLAEQFRFLGVLPALAMHDVLELGMSGHAISLGIRAGCWVGKRGVIGRDIG